MASATATASASASSFLLHHSAKSSKNLVTIFSCVPISRPRRPNLRKNYLRPKLLKTISAPPLEISDATPFHPLQKDSNLPTIDQFHEEVNEVKIQDFDQFGASDSGKLGMFSKNSFLKFGLWLAGAFVFHTVCALWGSYQIVEDDHELEMGVNGERDSRMNDFVSENVMLGTIDEPVQKKIEEIRVMAREARDRERLEPEENGLDGDESDFEDDDVEEGFAKRGIEKEVNEKLNKLKEKLENNRDKIPHRLENLKGKEKNGLDVNQRNEALIFKKRYKYKGAFSNQMDKPQGFSEPSEKEHSPVRESRLNFGNEDEERRRQERNLDIAEHKFPTVQDRNNGDSAAVTSDSGDPSIMKANEPTNHQNGTRSSNSLGDRQQLKQSGRSSKPHSGNEWWEKLPYVLVILMQQGHDDHQARGLYTLKSDSGSVGELSHVIAFQDRGDATNFCYLLQLYFEDLGDFSIDVVPLSMKELKEAMQSNSKRVIVVKKGQLPLFAGQRISDVEMALRSLMEQD